MSKRCQDLNGISDPRLHVVKMDVQNDESIIAAEKEVSMQSYLFALLSLLSLRLIVLSYPLVISTISYS